MGLKKKYNRGMVKSEDIMNGEVRIHQNHRIFVVDYTGLDSNEITQTMRHNTKITLTAKEPNSLVLMIMKAPKVDKQVLRTSIKLAPQMKPYTKKIAVVGLPTIVQTFVNYIVTIAKVNARVFGDESEAMDWLTE